jgi:hypothetical protein
MAVYPAGGRSCPITQSVADTIDRAIAHATSSDSRVDIRTLLHLIEHELEMQGTISRSDQHNAMASHFFAAAAEVGRILRVTA